MRLATILVVATLLGCRSYVANVNDLAFIPRGTNERDVQRVAKVPSQHEFTVVGKDGIDRCIAYCIGRSDEEWSGYLFLFHDDHLVKICDAHNTPASWGVTTQGPARGYDDVTSMVEQTLRSPDLSGQRLVDAVKAQRRDPISETYGPWATAVVVLAAPITLPEAIVITSRQDQLEHRWDATRVHIGDSPADVDQIFGAPQSHFVDSNLRECRLYGPKKLVGSPIIMRFAVWFEAGRASRILSEGFAVGDGLAR